MEKKKKTRHQLLRVATQYGIHIWAILVIANAVLVYAYQFSTQAASKKVVPKQQTEIAANTKTASNAQTEPPDPSTAQGPVINLSFSIPGIGSGGGTMKPLHPKRNLVVFLYPTGVNSQDPKVKPLFTIKGSAQFDTDPNSPTYTAYKNTFFDLGNTVTEGEYQIAFRTDQSMRNIVKETPTDVGGQTFSLSKGQQPIVIPIQAMNMGDTIPDDGDYEVDATDYNAFIGCYGEKNKTDFCKGKNYGDFDDNGVIDGIDYNILLRSLSILKEQGKNIPQVAGPSSASASAGRVAPLKTSTTPTKALVQKKTTKAPTPTVAPAAETSNGGGGGLIVTLLFIFLLINAGVAFFFYKTNEGIRNKIRSILHLSPTGVPPSEAAIDPVTGQPIEQPAQDPNAPIEQEQSTDATASEVAAGTEIPVEQVPAPEQTPPPPPAEPAPIAPSTETSPVAPAPVAATTPPAADGTVEKECYVKKKGPDEAGTGLWLLLTDDNGPVEAHYSKNDANDGFAKVKGIMKTENGKTFLEISELVAE